MDWVVAMNNNLGCRLREQAIDPGGRFYRRNAGDTIKLTARAFS